MSLLISLLLSAYDPLAVPAAPPKTLDLLAHDEARQRDVPLKIYLPSTPAPAPVLLFSHGLGGSKDTCTHLGEHWARRGYVAVFLQHPGSDEDVWKNARPSERRSRLVAAASVEQFLARVKDVSLVLDALTQWNTTPSHPLTRRLDLAHVGMAGHSFGAVTTQAVTGQSFPLGKSFTEPRIGAAVLLSPSVPRQAKAEPSFAKVSIPWLLMTGTRDDSPLGDQTAASRLGVFEALPPGEKYQLVLEGAEHSAFTDRALPGESGARNPNHHRLVRALSTAFFDATLKGSADARAWLKAGVTPLLQPGDRWAEK